jgi:hypothetical protein
MLRDRSLALEHDDGILRVAALELACGGQADDPGAYYYEIAFTGQLRHQQDPDIRLFEVDIA